MSLSLHESRPRLHSATFLQKYLKKLLRLPPHPFKSRHMVLFCCVALFQLPAFKRGRGYLQRLWGKVRRGCFKTKKPLSPHKVGRNWVSPMSMLYSAPLPLSAPFLQQLDCIWRRSDPPPLDRDGGFRAVGTW